MWSPEPSAPKGEGPGASSKKVGHPTLPTETLQAPSTGCCSSQLSPDFPWRWAGVEARGLPRSAGRLLAGEWVLACPQEAGLVPHPSPSAPETWDGGPAGASLPVPHPQAQEGLFPRAQPLPHRATAHPLCGARTMSAQTERGMGFRRCQHSAGPLGGWATGPGARGVPKGARSGNTCLKVSTWQVSLVSAHG